MYGSSVWWSLVFSLLVVVPFTGISLLGGKGARRNMAIAGGIMLCIYWFINFWVVWKMVPTMGTSLLAMYKVFWWWWVEALVMSIVVAVVSGFNNDRGLPSTGSIISVIAMFVIMVCVACQTAYWSQERVDNLVGQVQVTMEPPDVYPDTDADHMVSVSEQTAHFKARQAMAGSAERSIGTMYEIDSGTLMSIRDHMYWIFDLKFSGWLNYRRVNHIVPGYIMVDAEDPDLPAELKLGYEMIYIPGTFFGNQLDRYVWANGYKDAVITDITLEIDDNWRPYYTASIDQQTLAFRATVPKSMVVIDPQTGEITPYALDQIPDWVDRVYSQDTVEQLLNWWGHWGNENAPYKQINEASAYRFKVSQDPVLVYTEGGHPEWQAIMTSYNDADTAASYLVLFDARDNKMRVYQIPDLGLESTVEHTILNSSLNIRRNQPVHLALHKIYGVLTWVAPMIQPVPEDADVDSAESAAQGLALMPANDNNGGSLVIRTTKAEALSAYRQILAQGHNNSGPNEDANQLSVEGVVANLAQVEESGNTVYYIVLQDDAAHVYRYGIGGQSSSLEVVFVHVGARVRLSYQDMGTARRDISAYDDLDLNIEER